MFPTFESLEGFLVWLASGPGSLAAAGFFVAYVLERFTKWHNIPHDIKSLAVIAIGVGVSYLAKEFLSAEIVLANVEVNQMFLLLVYYVSNQVAYKRYFKM